MLLLAVAVCGVLLLFAGLALVVGPQRAATPRSATSDTLPGTTPDTMLGTTPETTPGTTPGETGAPADQVAGQPARQAVHEAARRAAQDAVAGSPMPVLPLSAATPQSVSTRDPGPPIVLPACADPGPANVPTGCPHTPQGAMAQLVAIDQTALQSGTLLGAREVIDRWALPGGPTRTTWSGVAAMAALLDGRAGGTATGGSVPVVVTPRTGLFKGDTDQAGVRAAVGEDFVVPCVQYELTLTIERTARVAVADCQRMVWTGQRWMIGAGPEPAQAPNVWPGTDASIDLGFRDLVWQP